MRCRAIKVKADVSVDERRHFVLVTVGNLRPVGCIDEVAWLELSPGMARGIAADLLEVASEVERATETVATK